MKKIAISLTVFSLAAFADLSVQQIEQMVAKIHEQREGIKLETLKETKENRFTYCPERVHQP